MKVTTYHADPKDDGIVVTVREAKKLIKENGGRAYIRHYDRDGSVFDIQEVRLIGDNSKVKYNIHL